MITQLAAEFPFNAVRRAWHSVSKVSESFFESSEEGSDDPLVELALTDPQKAAKFIKVAMSLGTAGNGAVSVISAIFLAIFWGQCEACDRPLQCWLICNSVLQCLQVAIRQKFLRNLCASETIGMASVQSCIVSLASTPAWRASKTLSLTTYAWLVLGTIWILNIQSCDDWLYRVVVAVVVQAILRVFILVWSFNKMTSEIAETTSATPRKVCGASLSQIQSLPVSRFSCGSLQQEDAQPGWCETCSICLSDYCQSEKLCHLPCGHQFHQQCAETWLRRNKKCPLCMCAIDATTSDSVSRVRNAPRSG